MKKPRRASPARRAAQGSTSAPTSQTSDDVYRRLFSLLPLPVWVFDRESLAFLEVNDEAVQVYGYSRDEFLHMTIKDIRPPDDVPRLLEKLAVVSEGPFNGRGWRHRKSDGTMMDVQVSTCTIIFDGRKAGLVVVHDVTADTWTEAERARLAGLENLERAQLQELTARLVGAQETERRDLARSLHDEIGQLLTALRLLLEGAGGPGRSEDILQIVEDLQSRVHATSLNLRPPMLDDLGLLPAFLWHVDRYLAQTGVRAHFSHEGLGRRFAPDIETVVFRVVQEALTNVAKYAGVREVGVRVTAAADHMIVDVNDHGMGFDVAKAVEGDSVGLTFMRERVRLLGGDVTVSSSRASGTRVTAWIPLARRQTPGA